MRHAKLLSHRGPASLTAVSVCQQEEDRPMTHQESQAKWLQDASNLVKRNAFFMKRALVCNASKPPHPLRTCQVHKNTAIRTLMMTAVQDDDNLREALRFSAAMLGELRTSLLTPQKYFELYMQAFDELRHLEVHYSAQLMPESESLYVCLISMFLATSWCHVQVFFKEEHSKGRSYADLYELVQHAGNVLPRL